MDSNISKKDLIYCEKCHKTLKRSEFYQSNNLEKYPNGGTIPICKKCLTMHVDN
jgi:NAD-dependent SIR2 family protein deacetylase